MGIAPYMVASTVIGVISQRLVRKICTDCKESYEASDEEKLLLGIDVKEPLTLYRGKG